MDSTPVTVIYGDGVGPEVMESTLRILSYAHAPIQIETVSVGQLNYDRGVSTGIAPDAWEPIRRNKILLKSPTTPPDSADSRNTAVALKKMLGLAVTVQDYPFWIANNTTLQHLTYIHDAIEGIYTGIEHRLHHDCYQLSYLTTTHQAQHLLQYAKEYAASLDVKTLTCMLQKDVLPLSERIIAQACDQAKQISVEEGVRQLLQNPIDFPVTVSSSLHAPVIAAALSHISSSPWFGSCSSIGKHYAMFAPSHNSYEDLEGTDNVNPSGMLHAAIQCLRYMGCTDSASKIYNAWVSLIEDQIQTKDMYYDHREGNTVSPDEFTNELCRRISAIARNSHPAELPPMPVYSCDNEEDADTQKDIEDKVTVGADIFFIWEAQFSELSGIITTLQQATEHTALKLQMVGSRGLKLWPDTGTGMHIKQGDILRARFVAQGIGEKMASDEHILELLASLAQHGLSWQMMEKLHVYDDTLGFTLAYGE